MSKKQIIKLGADDAFVAFSMPGESHHSLYGVDVFQDVLTDSNLSQYDFIVAPFVENNTPLCYFNYTKNWGYTEFEFKVKRQGAKGGKSKEEYLVDVNYLVDLIAKTELDKLVYSKTKRVDNSDTELGHLFQSLCKKYVDAFVFIYNIPNYGCWMGASPELLIVGKNNKFETVALAGTQSFSGSHETIKWGRKEVNEQKYIQDFIEDSLNKLGCKYEKSPTITSPAGKVCHIKTSYRIDDVSSCSELIKYLHPGPAISGTPKEKAIEVILDLESHNRKYYAGYLGPLHGRKGMEIFINLRSMEVFEDGFLLYLGGGITKDSNAESEWEETELKASTLESVILDVANN